MNTSHQERGAFIRKPEVLWQCFSLKDERWHTEKPSPAALRPVVPWKALDVQPADPRPEKLR